MTTAKQQQAVNPFHLTDYQLHIVNLLVNGYSSDEICRLLGSNEKPVAKGTYHNHTARIRTLLAVDTNNELVTRWIREVEWAQRLQEMQTQLGAMRTHARSETVVEALSWFEGFLEARKYPYKETEDDGTRSGGSDAADQGS